MLVYLPSAVYFNNIDYVHIIIFIEYDPVFTYAGTVFVAESL